MRAQSPRVIGILLASLSVSACDQNSAVAPDGFRHPLRAESYCPSCQALDDVQEALIQGIINDMPTWPPTCAGLKQQLQDLLDLNRFYKQDSAPQDINGNWGLGAYEFEGDYNDPDDEWIIIWTPVFNGGSLAATVKHEGFHAGGVVDEDTAEAMAGECSSGPV